MTNPEQRILIAQETIDILKQGLYQNKNGEFVEIRDDLLAAKTKSIHYSSDRFNQVFRERDRLATIAIKTSFEVNNETTLRAASRLVNQEGIEKVLCLNFASGKNPGGGFLRGTQAQEESLARATGLYPCIAQMTDMYNTNRNLGSALYTDDMIYSPQVPVIRDDDDKLLDKPFLVSILTAPAVKAGEVREKGNQEEIDRIESIMFARTEKLLSIAAIQGDKVLVLGAWGCGVFKNNPENVARYFYHHLVENPQLNCFFEKVVFAVLDNSRDGATINSFRSIFE
ncbi:TIGR02452 family protein [Microseira wollei]|uniref:Microbial-type PARG catalytic domain-containing protein n=1 Tax=Microseira wollei NIES-4236 TaxID=2530354 RepID=A0AAV3X5N8_9CYAN|nr:TIGR02452 family protein [Microseira wollei]GET35512.1 hypothetical protein MiSe_02540 [Microseira wollei NIES-4236]